MITGQKVNNTVVQSGGLGKKRKHAHPAFLCLANSHRSFWYHFDCYKLTSCCSSLLLNCSSTRAVVKYRLVCSCLHNWSKQCLGCHLQWCLSCYQLHAGSAVTLLLKYGRGRKQKSLVVFVHAFFFFCVLFLLDVSLGLTSYFRWQGFFSKWFVKIATWV